MDITPAGGRDGGSGTAGGGDLRLPPPEHGSKVHCDQDHYLPMSGGGAETGANDIHVVVGTGWVGYGRDTDDG